MMTKSSWWQRPKLRRYEEEEQERKATWLELFLDLVFVAAIAQLAHHLAGHVSRSGALEFGFLFIPVWWIWMGSTFYNDRFETDDVSHRLFTFLKMIFVAALAYHASHALTDHSEGFVLSYVGARVVQLVMWIRAGWHDAEARPLTTRYAAGFSASVVCWLASLAVPPPMRFYLWGAGLCCDLVTPLTTMGIEAKLPRLTSSHLPERFGLLIIIVLGESIVGVVAGIGQSHHFTLANGLLCVLAMSVAFSLWWLYFDHVIGRRPRGNIWWSLAWAYTHLILAMSLTALGAGVLNCIKLEGHPVSDPVRWLVCGAFSISFAALGILELTLAKEGSLGAVAVSRFGTAGAAILLGLWGAPLSALLLFTLLLFASGVQVVQGIIAMARQSTVPG